MLFSSPENPSAELLGGFHNSGAKCAKISLGRGGASVGAACRKPPIEKSGKRGSRAKLRVNKSMSI